MNTTKSFLKSLTVKDCKKVSILMHVAITMAVWLTLSLTGFAQNVGISPTGVAPNTSAGLDINFSNKGLLIPRVSLISTTDVATIPTPANSLLVYNTNAGMSSGSIGYWYWDGTKWVKLLSSASEAAWSISGNAGTARGTNFLGTTDNAGLSIRTDNINALNIDSLQNIGIGVENPIRKFEVNGSFRMHKDSFNIFHSLDLLPDFVPGIEYMGYTKNLSPGNGVFLNGIMHLPPAAGDTSYAVMGHINTSNGLRENFFLAQPGGNLIVALAGDSGSTFFAGNNGDMGMSTNKGSSDNNSVNIGTNGINLNTTNVDSSNYVGLTNTNIFFNHTVNGIGNTNMSLNDSIIYQNINSDVSNRASASNIRPDDYNIYNNDNDPSVNTSSGINFSSHRYNLYFNSPSNGSNFNMSDSSAYITSNAQFKFGIGTNSPTNSLHVYGNNIDPVRIEGLQSGSSSDNVITVDGSGVLHYSPPGGSSWSREGNAGITSGTDFLGTTDNQDLQFKINNTHAGIIKNDGQTFLGLNAGLDNAATQNTGFGAFTLSSTATGGNNTAIGHSALKSNSSGINNTAVGLGALQSNTTANANTAIGVASMLNNTSGIYNTAIGVNTLNSNTTGSNNMASGLNALFSNTTGSLNSGVGSGALQNNTTGNGNMASGANALFSNTTGDGNSASGVSALSFNTIGVNNTASGTVSLYNNTTGSNNMASGAYAMYRNTTGASNTASGSSALLSNTTGDFNSASGANALYSNTTGTNITSSGYNSLGSNITGNNNAAFGSRSLLYNTTGSNNTALGFQTLIGNLTGSYNTASGDGALTANITGSNNTALGYGADVVSGGLSNATAIGYNAKVGANNSLVLGGTGADQVLVGVGTTTPKSFLETAGSFAAAINIISASITLDSTHHTLIINTGTPVITLPAAAGNTRRIYNIINRTGAALTISTFNDYTGPSTGIAGHSKITIQSDGSSWYQIN